MFVYLEIIYFYIQQNFRYIDSAILCFSFVTNMYRLKLLIMSSNGVYLQDTPYGEGSGQIWLDEVICAGNETSLLACQHNDWADDDCSHSEDVTIRCG